MAIAATFGISCHAQSAVTIYGLLDSGIEIVNHTPTGTLIRQSSGSLSGTHFGIRGVEDLGGGRKAVFALESGFNMDTGTIGQGGRLFGRQAFVGLSNAYGTVTLGRQQNLLDDVMISFDPMKFGVAYSAVDHDLVMAGRADNAAKYVGSFGGATVSAMYARGYDFATNESGTPIASGDARNDEYSLGLSFTRSSFGIGAVVDQRHGRSVSQSDDTQRRGAVGVRYSRGNADAFAGYRWLESRSGQTTTGANLYWTGLTYHVTSSLQVTGSIYHTDSRNSPADPTSYVVAAEYYFSKRTEFFTSSSFVHNRGGSTLGVGGFGVNISGDSPQLGMVAGLRHRF
ncbi:porin [Cupriavidus pauculus]|uniref:porin n=1 Tax=Cupriavidus pauculus TaxID=82633 RepID=UPI001FD1782D|nr:porin [Cupriavidus pauculus]